jgi:hypothetical protein
MMRVGQIAWCGIVGALATAIHVGIAVHNKGSE